MYQQILVAVDGSETSTRAFEAALQLARDAGAKLQPLFVVDVPLLVYDVPGCDLPHARNALLEQGANVIENAVASMKRAGVQGTPRIIETALSGDDVAHCILRAANDFKADLVVTGTHGRRGFQRLVLGSVAECFLRIAQCAVLMIPTHSGKPVASGAQAAEPIKEPS
ncbi:universal stress protein [Paraburkholderia lacunae]|uniref:Universal stress protein UspA n=1 Tax=Paraburkholderia lacunae TaxID=2211104 RepID=A0A370N2B9_9BURK|nr:universal stress protein [Paraburkholderia lacunae]RDJ99746.1 universal stress protein UspA [Paraburkholderia lacunae]